MSWQETPIFIINRNNLERGFRKQIDWLLDAGMVNVNVVDNASTYQPLLNFYDEKSEIKVIRKDKNYGPWVFWETKMHEQQEASYVVSDADCVPAPYCPNDLVEKLLFVQQNHPAIVLKVGPGIRIDNIPDHYGKKKQVVEHELQFWAPFQLETHEKSPWVVEGTPPMYDSLIDTTFALYWPKQDFPGWHHHYRLAPPYLVEHYPWYEDSMCETEEHKYYRDNANMGWASWEAKSEDSDYRREGNAGPEVSG